MAKFVVEYQLPYTQVVRVGVEADSHKKALQKARAAFNDTAPFMIPVLTHETRQTGPARDFHATEVSEWPEPDASVSTEEEFALMNEVFVHCPDHENDLVNNEPIKIDDFVYFGGLRYGNIENPVVHFSRSMYNDRGDLFPDRLLNFDWYVTLKDQSVPIGVVCYRGEGNKHSFSVFGIKPAVAVKHSTDQDVTPRGHGKKPRLS